MAPHPRFNKKKWVDLEGFGRDARMQGRVWKRMCMEGGQPLPGCSSVLSLTPEHLPANPKRDLWASLPLALFLRSSYLSRRNENVGRRRSRVCAWAGWRCPSK